MKYFATFCASITLLLPSFSFAQGIDHKDECMEKLSLSESDLRQPVHLRNLRKCVTNILKEAEQEAKNTSENAARTRATTRNTQLFYSRYKMRTQENLSIRIENSRISRRSALRLEKLRRAQRRIRIRELQNEIRNGES